MVWYAVKLLVSAGIIVLISELSKKLPLLASLIASLPLVSVLGMIWMYGEKVEVEKIAAHAEGTFWYVLPSLPMFLLMPWMLKKGISFPAGKEIPFLSIHGISKNMGRDGRTYQKVPSACAAIFSTSTFSPYIQIIPKTETSGREAMRLASRGNFLESSDMRTIIPAETSNFTAYQTISFILLLTPLPSPNELSAWGRQIQCPRR